MKNTDLLMDVVKSLITGDQETAKTKLQTCIVNKSREITEMFSDIDANDEMEFDINIETTPNDDLQDEEDCLSCDDVTPFCPGCGCRSEGCCCNEDAPFCPGCGEKNEECGCEESPDLNADDEYDEFSSAYPITGEDDYEDDYEDDLNADDRNF